MTTETTDPLETVMEAVSDYARFYTGCRCVHCTTKRERLRLHVQLALAKARQSARYDCGAAAIMAERENIAALEARLQEAMMAAEWEQGKTWRELVDIHVGHLLAGEADHHGVRSRPIKTLLDQAERDLAQARADSAKYRAALELFANDKRWRYDGTTWRFYGEDPQEIARAALEPA